MSAEGSHIPQYPRRGAEPVTSRQMWDRPGQLGSLRLDHRLIMGSMHLNLEARDDHGAALAAFYAERARGGASLIVTGGIAVNRVGAGGRMYAIIGDPEHEQGLARAVAAAHEGGAKIAAQLFHAGRYAFESAFGLTPVAPSAVYSRFSRCMPEAMTEDQIRQTLADFARAAATVRALGFDAIEVMASEGYVVNQFLSPLTNQRDDHWGGDAVRRRNFPLELLRMIKHVSGELPVIFRISGADLVPDSSTPEEIADFAVALADEGVDAINVGVGWHEAQIPTVQTLVPQGVWVPVAESIKDALVAAGHDVPVIASNRVNHVDHAEQILAGAKIDFVSMARPFLADPAFVSKARNGRLELVNTCIACNEACIDRSIGDTPVSCLVNPRAGRELEFPQGAGATGRFAVIGGGPAGLEAARALADLGNQVTLYEAEDELGGQFRMARRVPGKRDFGETIRYFTAELARLGVDVRLGHPITDRDEAELSGCGGIVLATGVLPREVELPGADRANVISYHQALADPESIGDRVAIIGGGGIAVDLAHLLVDDGTGDLAGRQQGFLGEWGLAEPAAEHQPPKPTRTVTLMRRTGRVGSGMGLTTRWAVVGSIRHHGVRMLTDIDYQEITDDGLVITDADGERQLIAADTVIIAAGQERNDSLVAMIAGLGVPYRVVGGAESTAGLNAVRATSQGLQAAYELARSKDRVGSF
ncbi:2,4-dienoyl-CoA reductase [Microlunatus endophyticus]|uniref:2,4-dienoyl-CoA reductase n=1 Tax=Microlunatus endophyticus TaxID=1716077 RepID=A0A917W467_9ACTN|nr:FAD-dependent oxidoreductase [Microlunatus endophyticus]GGL65440.1 2,4-dienoyl-CoA reductase [Microlunatus endophyticus]